MNRDQPPPPDAGAPTGAPAGGPGPASRVAAAAAVMAEAVAELARAVREGVSASADAQALSVLDVVDGALSAGGAVYLDLVRDLDRRPDAVPGARTGSTAQTYLMVARRKSRAQAARDVRAARALDPCRPPTDPCSAAGSEADAADPDPYADGEVHAPALGAAYAAGEVSREHVDLAVRALDQLPKALLRQVDADGERAGARADAFLAAQARTTDPDAFRRVCAQLKGFLAPGTDEDDTEAYRRRFCSMRVTEDGTLILRAELAADQAPAVRAAIESAARPHPATEAVDRDGRTHLVRDERTKGQRQADALAGICDHHNACTDDTAKGESHVMVITDLDQLAAARAARATDEADGAAAGHRAATGHGATADHGTAGHGAAAGHGEAFRRAGGFGPGRAHCLQTGPVTALTLQALACDAVLQAVVLDRSGAVLHLGRTVRTVSTAQRRALIARDRGCVIPGCHAPPRLCDAHHVTWWRHGGLTDLQNLALVCRRHHADIHAGVWTVEMVDGVPYGIPPRWANPARPRLRNTVHHGDVLVRHFTAQLLLDLTERAGPRARAPAATG